METKDPDKKQDTGTPAATESQPTAEVASTEESGQKSGVSSPETSFEDRLAKVTEALEKSAEALKKNSETINALNRQVEEQKLKIEGMDKVIKSREPIKFQGECVGTYNYNDKQMRWKDESRKDEYEFVKKEYNKLMEAYPGY